MQSTFFCHYIKRICVYVFATNVIGSDPQLHIQNNINCANYNSHDDDAHCLINLNAKKTKRIDIVFKLLLISN